MKKHVSRLLLLVAFVFALNACDKVSVTGSKLTRANYDQISEGMSKAQVQTVLGQPKTTETKDMVIFSKTTYRYEEGAKFALITFKNDQVSEKQTNLDH